MNGRSSKKLRKMARKQARQAMPYLWAEVKRQFFAMLPKMSFKERVKLAWRIIWAKKVRLEKN